MLLSRSIVCESQISSPCCWRICVNWANLFSLFALALLFSAILRARYSFKPVTDMAFIDRGFSADVVSWKGGRDENWSVTAAAAEAAAAVVAALRATLAASSSDDAFATASPSALEMASGSSPSFDGVPSMAFVMSKKSTSRRRSNFQRSRSRSWVNVDKSPRTNFALAQTNRR